MGGAAVRGDFDLLRVGRNLPAQGSGETAGQRENSCAVGERETREVWRLESQRRALCRSLLFGAEVSGRASAEEMGAKRDLSEGHTN